MVTFQQFCSFLFQITFCSFHPDCQWFFFNSNSLINTLITFILLLFYLISPDLEEMSNYWVIKCVMCMCVYPLYVWDILSYSIYVWFYVYVCTSMYVHVCIFVCCISEYVWMKDFRELSVSMRKMDCMTKCHNYIYYHKPNMFSLLFILYFIIYYLPLFICL